MSDTDPAPPLSSVPPPATTDDVMRVLLEMRTHFEHRDQKFADSLIQLREEVRRDVEREFQVASKLLEGLIHQTRKELLELIALARGETVELIRLRTEHIDATLSRVGEYVTTLKEAVPSALEAAQDRADEIRELRTHVEAELKKIKAGVASLIDGRDFDVTSLVDEPEPAAEHRRPPRSPG